MEYIARILKIFDASYTPLAILAITLAGSILIFLFNYLSRWNNFYSYFAWRSRAAFGCIKLAAALLIIKGVLRILK